MKKFIKILLISVVVTLIVNFVISREVTLYLFTQDKENSDVQVSFFIDKELVFEGIVGYDMFGKQMIERDLRGGIHKLKIVSNDKVIHRTIFVLGNHFVITWWDTTEPSIVIDYLITPFYFV